MACKIPNQLEFISNIKNKKFAYELKKEDTLDDIDVRLKHTQNNVVLEEDSHKYYAGEHQFYTTATTIAKKKYGPFTDNNNMSTHNARFGTYIHDVFQKLLTGGDIEDISSEWKLTKGQLSELKKVADSIIKKAEKIQKSIDPNAEYKIYTEQKVFNSKKDRCSTADVIIIFSNKTAMVHDFKTIEHKKDDIDTKTGLVKSDAKINRGISKFKLQLDILAEDLKVTYGVTDIVSGSIIPIPVRFNYEKVGKEFKVKKGEIKSLETPMTEKTVTSELLLLLEKTGIKSIDQYLKAKYKEVEDLVRRKQWAKANEGRDIIHDMVIKNNILRGYKMALGRFEDISTRLEEPEFNPDGTRNKEYVNSLELSDLWYEIKSLETLQTHLNDYIITSEDDGDKIRNEIQEFMYNIVILKHRIDAEIISREFTKYTDKTTSDGLLPSRMDNVTNLWGLGLADKNNSWFQMLNDLKTKTEQQANLDYEEFMSEWRVQNEKINKYINSIGRKAFTDMIFNPKTQNLIGKLSSEYYEQRSKAIKDKDLKWFKANHEEKYTQAEYENKKQKYEERQKAFLDSGEITKQTHDKRIVDWINNNSYASINAWKDNRLVRIKNEEKFYSDGYKKIQNTPAEEFYKFYTKWMYKFAKNVDRVDGITSNFVPYVREELMEKLMYGNYGLGSLPSNLRGALLDAVTVHDDTAIIEYDEFGNPSNSVPIFFTNPVLDAEGQPIPGINKSKDFMRSLALFGQMSINYKHFSKTEELANIMLDMFQQNAEIYQTDMRGNLVIKGASPEVRKATPREVDVFRAFVDIHWYNINIRSKDSSIGTTKEGREVSMNQMLLSLKSWWTTNTLGLGFIQAAGSWVAGKSNAIMEGSKGIYYTNEMFLKATKNMTTQTEKMFAFAEFMNISAEEKRELEMNKNEKYSHLGHLMNTVTKKEYSDWFRNRVSNKLLMGIWTIESQRRDVVVLGALSQNYGIDKDKNFVKFTKSMLDGTNLKEEYKKQGYTSMYDLFEFKDGIPNFKGLTPTESIELYRKFRLAAKRIKSGISGEVSSEDKNYVSTFILGNMLLQYKSWMPGVFRERFGSLTYNKNTMTAHQGRYIALFKSLKVKNENEFLVVAFLANLGKILADVALLGMYSRMRNGDIKNSRFKLNELLLKTDYEQWKEKNFDLAEDIDFEKYLEIREAQLNASITEMRILALFLMAMFILGSLNGDDDDETYLSRKTYALLRKSYSEIVFMWNPLEWNRTIAKPLPLTSMSENVFKVLSNGLDESIDEFSGRDDKQDKTGLLHYTTRVFIPAFSNLGRIFEFSDTDKQYMQKGF